MNPKVVSRGFCLRDSEAKPSRGHYDSCMETVTPQLFIFIFSFHFHFIEEGSPSTRVVLQGALHLKTLIYNYILKRIITI